MTSQPFHKRSASVATLLEFVAVIVIGAMGGLVAGYLIALAWWGMA